MAATFGDPLTLSKHDISPKATQDSAPVLVSCTKGSKTEYATTGVHGEGINIIDLTSLQPEAATLLGPESSFACPPVTRVVEKGQMERRRQTYAIINSPATNSPTKKTQTLSMWSSTEGLTSLSQERTVTLEGSAAALYALDSIPDKVILISPEGLITTYNSDLQQAESENSPLQSQILLFSFVFDASHCSFAQGGQISHLNRAIVATIVQRKKAIFLRVCSIDQTVETIGETPAQLSGHNIVSVSCNRDGCLSFLDKGGSLFNFMIQSRRDGIGLLSLEQLPLHGLHPTGMSINCVGSTHVLVAGFDKTDLDIVLLMWDVQYGVLLAERRLPKPNTFSTISQDRLHLQISPCDSAQSIITTFSTKPHSRRDTPASGLKAVVMVIPHIIPIASSLANAIGRASAGEKWLASAPLPDSSGSKSYEDGREAMLASVVEAIKNGQADVADKIFFEWETEQRALVKAIAKEGVKRQLAALVPKRAVNGTAGKGAAMDPDDTKDAKDVHPDPKVRINHVSNQIDWGHSFLTRLMQAVLRPVNSEGDCSAYSSKIPSYFLERKLISDGIIEGGVLKALQDYGDWESIRWVLRNTVDVSEDHLISLLLHRVRLHRKTPKARAENAMDIDNAAHARGRGPLTLPQVFGHVIAYPTSIPSLRRAIRQHFSQVEDAIVLIEVVNTWIFDSAKKATTIKLGDVDEEPKRGEQTTHERAVEKDGLPRLDLLVSFVSCLLDAVLLDLLQYRKAHRPLRIMSTRIAPYAPYLENLDRLRGPLEPFVLADRRGMRSWEGHHKKLQRGKEQKEDNHTLNANLYQVEEFFV